MNKNIHNSSLMYQDHKIEKNQLNESLKFAERPKSNSIELTPMMTQYITIKEEHLNDILFYRMGDFYEMFFEDAIVASSVLEITLTQRGSYKEKKIPMCGIPYHSADNYLGKLLQKGYRVAICKKKKKPSDTLKSARIPLRREVVRVMTPGTITEENLLTSEINNFLTSWSEIGKDQAMSWMDLTTGEFFVEKLSLKSSFESVLERISPKEIILPKKLNLQIPDFYKKCISFQDETLFNSKTCENRLKKFFNVSSMNVYGDFDRSCFSASGALLGYIELTQKGKKPLLKPLKFWKKSDFLEIDMVTRRSLELVKTQSGERSGSFFQTIKHTVTGSGGRLLLERLNTPLLDKEKINKRLDSISILIEQPDLLSEIRKTLSMIPDIQRSLGRLQLQRGGPRDLGAIKDGCYLAIKVRKLINKINLTKNNSSEMKKIAEKLNIENQIPDFLNKALSDELPLITKGGSFIKNAYSKKLDKFRLLKDKSKQFMVSLQEKYIRSTEIPSLKIKHNNVLGYHIEIRNIHENKIINIEEFVHRQTTAQTKRFTTIDLAELERQIFSSQENALSLELEIYNELVEKILESSTDLSIMCRGLSQLDVAASNAILADMWNYCRPTISDNTELLIKGGRHPVVEQFLDQKFDNKFFGNDINLENKNLLWLLTGPNMGGKSTFLRQNALISILAQMGCYVPADSAKVGISDRIFSRVGSGDDLSKGESTFMLEMIETASILNQATSKSLVILDEIGRGTATWDGLSLAWAIIEHIHDSVKCRTLFATHYHELKALENHLENISFYTVEVKEYLDEIIFLHRVVKGKAKKSYGIQVARLAGLPNSVLIRAKDILESLETNRAKENALSEKLPLFENNYQEQKNKLDYEIIEEIKKINPDKTTPHDALDLIYKLKSLI